MLKKLLVTLVFLALLVNDSGGKGHRGHRIHRGNHHKWGSVTQSPSIHSYPPSMSGLSGSGGPWSSWNKYPSSPGLSGTPSGSKYPPSVGLSGSVINTPRIYPPSRGRPLAGTGFPSNANLVGSQLYPPYPGLTANDRPSYPSSSGLSGSRIEPTPNFSGWPTYNSQKYSNNNSPSGFGYGPYNNYTPPFH